MIGPPRVGRLQRLPDRVRGIVHRMPEPVRQPILVIRDEFRVTRGRRLWQDFLTVVDAEESDEARKRRLFGVLSKSYEAGIVGVDRAGRFEEDFQMEGRWHPI